MCCGTTKPVGHDYRARVESPGAPPIAPVCPRARAAQLEEPEHPHAEEAPLPQLEQSLHGNADPAQP